MFLKALWHPFGKELAVFKFEEWNREWKPVVLCQCLLPSLRYVFSKMTWVLQSDGIPFAIIYYCYNCICYVISPLVSDWVSHLLMISIFVKTKAHAWKTKSLVTVNSQLSFKYQHYNSFRRRLTKSMIQTLSLFIVYKMRSFKGVAKGDWPSEVYVIW